MPRTMKMYRSYMFKEKDPIIDVIRTAVDDSKKSYLDVSADSGVSTHTIYQWFHGKTKRPQHATVMAVLRAVDKELIVVDYKPRQKLKVVK